MGIGDKVSNQERILALEVIRAAVLRSMDKTSDNPVTFQADDLPQETEPDTLAAMALTLLCTVVGEGEMETDRFNALIDDAVHEEGRR